MPHYIIQNMQQFLDINYLISDDSESWWLRKHKKEIIDVEFDDLFTSDNKRYMVVAEPGYGKTRLLKEIGIKANQFKQSVYFIDAKKIDNLTIEESLKKCKFINLDGISEEELQKKKVFKNVEETDIIFNTNTIICVDALDEVAVNKLYELFEKIEDFIDINNNVKVFLSCRTHHLKKVSYDFQSLDFKFITLQSFSGVQIQNFIEERLGKKFDLEDVFNKSKMSNLDQFISIPRYLYYFTELLDNGSIEEVINLSRSKMFEHFIYRKLDKELTPNTPQSQIDILKRVLEKLALIMKINQVSEISKDELMSIFDKMDSNFSQIAFRDDLINKLYDRSLIKDNIDSIEFENQEFLDFLSAKELARFEKVEQVFFDIAMEPHIVELYTSWFYVLPFLLELKPSMAEILLDFLDNNTHRVLSAEYFEALTSIEPESLLPELKSRIFDMVFNYFTNHNKWFLSFSLNISRPLARYYDSTKYSKILTSVDGRKNKKDNLHVRRTNAVELIEILIEYGHLEQPQIIYWQKKITQWLKLDPVEHQYLHQNIVSSLAVISQGNFQWIQSLYFIFENGVQVQNNYADTCFKIAPDDRFSIDVYLGVEEFDRKNRVSTSLRMDREYKYLLQLNTSKSFMYALTKIFENEKITNHFCHSINLYDNEDLLKVFQRKLSEIYDEELSLFMRQIVTNSLIKRSYHDRECNKIYKVIISVLLEKDTSYFFSLTKGLYTLYEGKYWIIHELQYDYLFKHVNESNFDIFLQSLEIFEDKKVDILLALYFYELSTDEIKHRIMKLYSKEILDKEKESKNHQKEQLFYCKDWAEMIEPEPKKFSVDLFRYYNGNKSLKECPEYDKNLKEMVNIAKEVLKNYNPLRGKIEKNGSSATIYGLGYFRDCIEFIYNEEIELTQEIKDNVFRYLPFDINSDYEITLSVAGIPSRKAIEDIVAVYAGKREDDLGIYHVRGFIELYNKMKLLEIVPVLLMMLENKDIAEYEREYIIDSLPSTVLTVDKIRNNMVELDKESDLYKKYLSVLVKNHHDNKAIDEAYEWTINRAEQLKGDDLRENALDRVPNLISIVMTHTEYPIERDKELLLFASELSEKDKKSGGDFLRNIVEAHLKFLIGKNLEKSFKILNDMEKFILANSDRKDLHWFEYKLGDLKKIYLTEVSSKNIMESIKTYNRLQEEDYMAISSPIHLLEIIQSIIEDDIRRWIEDEGAYKYINELAKKKENLNAEDFIQKTIKSQIELALLRKGFRETDFSIKREEQLLDDKRLDFTISYGFIGSVLLELKLSHNSEAIASRKDGKAYVGKLKSYMEGSQSHFGLFVIFNIKDEKKKFDKKLIGLNKLYEDEKEITILGVNCRV